jgi:hypothetical protein
MDGPRWLSRQGQRNCSGAPGPRRQLAGGGCYPHSGPPFWMRFRPKGAARGGDSPKGFLGGGGDRSSARDGGVLLSQPPTMVRASSGGAPTHPRPRAASPCSPQPPPRLQLRWAMVKIGARQRWLGQRRRLSLGPKSARYRALFIGVFG